MKTAAAFFSSLRTQSVFLFFILGYFFFTSCSESVKEKATALSGSTADSISRSNVTFVKDCKVFERRARKMDSVLLQQLEINKQSAMDAIKAFTEFADYCHDDTLAPIFYLKTAQVARAIENIPVAKDALERCLQNYPSYPERPAVLFFLAQLYDEPNYLNNEQEALRLYKAIVEEFPRSDWALSARGAMQFIGKTDEEMIEEFNRRNKEKK